MTRFFVLSINLNYDSELYDFLRDLLERNVDDVFCGEFHHALRSGFRIAKIFLDVKSGVLHSFHYRTHDIKHRSKRVHK